MKIETSDIPLFWSAYDLAYGRPPQERQAIFDSEYFAKGSIGLHDFWRLRIESSAQLVGTIDAHPRYYQALRQISGEVPTQAAKIEVACRRFDELIGGAVLSDTYLLIGRMNCGGTEYSARLLIGVDMFGQSPTTPIDELSSWNRDVLWPLSDLSRVVLHEFVHANQRYQQTETVLAECVKEGVCDFIVTHLLGPHDSIHYRYGRRHEEALWQRFKGEMHTQNYSNWLGEGTNAKDRPADLGYFVGHQICAAYFARQNGHAQAMRDMLQIRDFDEFLEQSGYTGAAPELSGG